jgi:hypothetical protein
LPISSLGTLSLGPRRENAGCRGKPGTSAPARESFQVQQERVHQNKAKWSCYPLLIVIGNRRTMDVCTGMHSDGLLSINSPLPVHTFHLFMKWSPTMKVQGWPKSGRTNTRAGWGCSGTLNHAVPTGPCTPCRATLFTTLSSHLTLPWVHDPWSHGSLYTPICSS